VQVSLPVAQKIDVTDAASARGRLQEHNPDLDIDQSSSST
jgi:hypothetical protein